MDEIKLDAVLPTTRYNKAEKKKLELEAKSADRSLSSHIRFVLMNRKAKK